MGVPEQQTCGQGLAEHSVLPAQIAELLASVAANLEAHMQALDLGDDDAREEHAAYVRLAGEHRRIAEELRATSEEMAAYRDLPMGRHDQAAMTSPGVAEALARFVGAQRELAALLDVGAERGQQMLAAMGDHP